MDERATGLVLRTYPLTETSLIVHWLTKEHGRIATVAKGARRAKSSFRGKIDLFFFCEFSFARSRRSELHTLREVSLLKAPTALRTDLSLLQRVSYAAALITQTTETDTPVPDLFDLFRAFVEFVVPASAGPLFVLAFELKLLHILGLAPSAAELDLTSGSKRLIEHLTETDWPNLGQLKLSVAQFNELNRFLHGFLLYHLGKIPSGRARALEASA
jgi:DNA repair protein RecO (recombination protein O)